MCYQLLAVLWQVRQSFEDFRGMKAVPYGTVICLGGGEPVSVESIPARSLRHLAGAKMEVCKW